MNVERRSPENSINDLSSITSVPDTPPSLLRSSSFNYPRSSIRPASGSFEAKSFLTRVYEGFCHILALIWNFFFPPLEQAHRSRSDSEDGASSPLGSCLSDEEQLRLKGSDDDDDLRSNISGSDPGSHFSGLSTVFVRRPSEHGSELSRTTGSSRGGVPSADLSLGSNPISLGSEPLPSGSNPPTGSDVSREERFGYTLAKAEEVINEADIPSFQGHIPTALKISVQNKNEIQEVLKTIGEKTAWQLGYNSFGALWGSSSGDIDRLKQLGANIDRDVHPLRFLLEIFLNPDSNAAIKALHASKHDKLTGRNFMWYQFVTDLGNSFDKRRDITELTPFFAHRLGLHTDNVKPFVDAKDWKGLLKYLVVNAKTPKAVSAR